MSTYVFGNLAFDTPVKTVNVAAGISTVNLADLYLASAAWSSEPENMVYDNPATAGGLFPLDDIGEKFTGLVCRLNECNEPPGGGNTWRLKFADRAGPGIERVTVNGGDFLAQGAGNDPLLPAAFVFPVIELSTSPTLIKTSSGLTEGDKDDIAARVWDRLLSDHTTAGTFGAWVGKKLLSVTKFLGLK